MYLIDYNASPIFTDTARCITARQNSGMSHHKGEHSAVFVDMNESPQITKNARCLNTRMDLGITNGTHKGERSGVLEEAPRAIINPFKKTTRQNGRRIKNPNEPMFTITVTDRHGVVHRGRIRRLMPVECWRLQGYDKYIENGYFAVKETVFETDSFSKTYQQTLVTGKGQRYVISRLKKEWAQ